MFKIFKKKETKSEIQTINEKLESIRQSEAELQSKVINYLWPLLLGTTQDNPKKVDIDIDYGPALPAIKVTALWLDDNAVITASTDIQDEVCFDEWFTLEEQVEILNNIKD